MVTESNGKIMEMGEATTTEAHGQTEVDMGTDEWKKGGHSSGGCNGEEGNWEGSKGGG